MNATKLGACALVTGWIVLGSLGCAPAGDAKVPVAGLVTLDGTPLPDGTIYLRRTDGEFFSFDVDAGKCQGEAMPGEYRVEISAIREETPDATAVAMYGADAPKREVNYIPPRYNVDSKLTATVGNGGAKDLKFELETD